MTGLQSARILHARGVRVVGLAGNPRSPFSRTRALWRVHEWRADSPADVVPSGEYDSRPLLLPCTDDAVHWLNERRDDLAPSFRFVLPEHDALDRLADKSRFYRHAQREGLAVPETLFLEREPDCDAVGASLGFPCVVKPPRRTVEWRAAARRKVFVVHSALELVDVFRRYRNVVDELIAQRWVAGGDDEMYSLYSCLDSSSQPLAHVVAHKLRQWPLDTGCGCLAEERSVPEVAQQGLQLLQSVSFVGLSSVQFKRDAGSGRFFIIEVNAGRPALNMPLAEKSGVDMLHTFYCDAVGLPVPEKRSVTHPGAKWICWKTDLAASWALMRRRQLTFGEWVHSIRGRKWSAVLSWRDPSPFLFDMMRKTAAWRPRRPSEPRHVPQRVTLPAGARLLPPHDAPTPAASLERPVPSASTASEAPRRRATRVRKAKPSRPAARRDS
jgi:predicted ATP-grasp superfamily ATP-dependent carboligase